MPKVVIVSASEPRAGFGKERRLHTPAEFSAVLSARRVVKGENFDLHFAARAANANARLGMIVPKKFAKAAYQRNAVKRQAREAFRLLTPPLAACDLVLRMKRRIGLSSCDSKPDHAVWRSEIESLFKKLGVVSA